MKNLNKVMAILFSLLIISVSLPSYAEFADSKGREFFVAFPKSTGNGFGNLSLLITGEADSQGTVQVSGNDINIPFEVKANVVTIVDIPSSVQNLPNDQVSKLGVKITSTNEVSVYGLNQKQYTTDAFMALPTDALGLEYLIASYKGLGAYASQLTIVGTSDNTQVQITPSVDSGQKPKDEEFSISLNKGETYYLESANDLTGSVIKASSPVAVMGSVNCANVPVGARACDHIIEMMPPMATWGKSFLTVPLATRKNGDIFRIIASEENTVVTINGVDEASLNKGEFHEQVITEYSEIHTNKPVLVAQYSAGQSFDGVISDPFMMLVPPSEQFLDDYTFNTLSQNIGFSNSYVNVVIPSSSIETVILDGEVVDSSLFQPIGQSGFSGAQVKTGEGSHHIYSSVPFGIYVYGFGNFDSYGYPGGMGFNFINAVFSNVKITSILSTNNIDLDNSSFNQTPSKIETIGDETIIEWQFNKITAEQIEDLEYEIVLKNPIAGEIRRVTNRLELSYLDARGREVKRSLGEQVVHVADSKFDITVTTDKTEYLANEEVKISSLVKNLSDFEASTNIKISIYDKSGVFVKQVSLSEDEIIPATGEKTYGPIFNTASQLIGDYEVRAELIDDSDQIIAVSKAPFVIKSTIAGDPQATLRLTLDKPVYNTSDQISLGSLSHNITANVLIQAATVKIKILKPDGSLYAELEQTVGDLASGNLRQLNSLQALNSVGIGSYSVTAELLDADQTVLATAQTQFDVAEQRSLTISGQVAVAQQSIFAGAPQQCLNTINNNGSISLDNAVFRQVLVNVDTATETIFADQQATAIATGSQYQFTSDIDTSALAQGQYSCILQRKDGPDWQTLAFQFFKVDMLAMTASLDAAQYPANTAVNIALKVDNPTDVDFSGKVKLTVMDENSNIITELTPVVAQVPATGSINLSASWNTVTTLAGNYKILASLINSADQSIELHTLPFEITAIINATLDLSVDQSSYLAGDKVKLSNLLKNTTLNKPLANAILKTVVKNAAGTVVYTQDTPLETLAPNASKTVALDFILPADAALGTYSVESQVVKGSEQLAEISRSFDVIALGATLTLETDKASYLAKDTVKLTQLVTNTTVDKPLTNATLKTLVKNATGTVVYSKDTPLETLAPNASKTVALDFILPTDAALGTYSVESQVVKGSEQLAVISRSFDVIALGATLTLETDKASYLAKDTVKLTQLVTNTTVDKPLANATLKTVVKNATGTVVYTQDTPLETLAPNASKTVALDFILPADAALGTYSVESQVVKGSEQLAVISRAFDVIALGATLTLETDKASYLAKDTVKLTQEVKNTTVDKPLTGATLKTVVKNATGTVVYSKDTPLETLAPNTSKTVALDFILPADAALGTYSVESQVVKGSEQLAVISRSFDVIALGATLTLETDKASYLASDTVKLTQVVKNTTVDKPLTGATLKTVVKNAAGTVVYSKDTALETLAPNASKTIELDFVLQTNSDPGTYHAESQLVNAMGQLAEASGAFEVIALSVSASLHVTTDKPAYLAEETVKLTSLIENTSLLADLENATLKTVVKDSTGAVVLTKETSLNQLSANASQTVDLDFSFASDAPLGTFTVTSELVDSANKPLAKAQTTFKLLADVSQAIVGTVSVLDKEIKPGDKQQCIGHVENTSDTDFADLSIRQIVMPLGSSNELGHNDASILLAKKSVKELIYALDDLTLAVGDYQCVLQAKIGGVYITLDTSIFKVSDDVAPQEITLDVSTDKPEYEQGKQVKLKHSIENKTPAIPLQNATLQVRVTNPDGVTVFEQQKPLNTLSAKGASLAKIALAAKADQSIVLDFTLPADAVLGDYTVTSKVLDASQTVLSTDNAIFRVIAAVAPIPTLSGWSLLLLILSLGLSGLWTRRPRRLRIVKRR